MTLRCWPGALAYITHPSMWGKPVEVLRAAPRGEFALPDGFTAAVASSAKPRWVIQSLGAPFVVFMSDGSQRDTMYAVLRDEWLRPIQPPPAPAVREVPAEVVA